MGEKKLLDYLPLKPKALNNKKKLQSYLRLRKRRRGRRSCLKTTIPMWIRIPIGGWPKKKGQIFAKNAIKEREKLKNSLGLKATLLARLKPMISPGKLMQARVPPPKALRLAHPHRLDPENQPAKSQKARKKVEKIDFSFCCRRTENKPM